MTQSTKQIKKFDAEVGKILNLMINSIYTNKEIFIRELISNASDACDKLRYIVANNHNLINKQTNELKIQVKISKKKKSIIISDNGIGMSKEELINNLGTVASSGTQKFLENYNNKSNNEKNGASPLIGQFGVGFYSAYMVSDLVKVISVKTGEKEVYEWSSNGKEKYSIEKSDEKLISGTKIILTIKDSEIEFLEMYRVKQIINKYSEHVSFPIELSSDNGKIEIINKTSAIWTKNPSKISENEYENFYKNLSQFQGKPFMTIHNKVEGIIEYTNLLFIPDSKPFDLFHPDRKTKVKLYIKKVFISEENNELIPSYLRFLRGVVDSEDLPLNISRETLQQNTLIKKIKSLIVKKVLTSLKIKSKEQPKKYELFWKNFGEVLKEGLCDSTTEEKNMLLEISKFYSTTSESNYINLDQYIDNMIEGQEKIYFLNGNNLESLRNNPQLEGFKKRGITVLLLNDHVDNFWVNTMQQYKNKHFQSITNEKIDLNKIKNIDDKENKKSSKESYKDHSLLINFIKEILNNRIKDVVISSKLVDSPACISILEGGMNPRMEKFLMEQNHLNSKSARIFEINPNHKIFKKISSSLLKKNVNHDLNKHLIEIIYAQAYLIEGDTIDNPSDFACKLNYLLEKIV